MHSSGVPRDQLATDSTNNVKQPYLIPSSPLITPNEDSADAICLPRCQHKEEDINSNSLNLKLPRDGNKLDNSHLSNLQDLLPRDKHNLMQLDSFNGDSGAFNLDRFNSVKLANNQDII